jgi:integrase
MPSINFIVRSKKNIAPVTVRFTNGREFDLFCATKIIVSDWSALKQKTKSKETNALLSKLTTHILEAFNKDYSEGVTIDKGWLSKVINESFNRPKKTIAPKEFVKFGSWWLENNDWVTSKNKPLEGKAKSQYEAFLSVFEKYNNKVVLTDIDNRVVNGFISYMEDESYEPGTIKRYVGRLRFFLSRAKEYNFDIDPSAFNRVYVSDPEDVLDPYLNEQEINLIFNKDLSFDPELDNIRDLFILGLRTGLRISDFNNNLNLENINDGFIEIKTKKTGVWTAIPLHKQVKLVLSKRFGQLPEKVSDKKFNKKIKTICMLCEIDGVMKGKVFDKSIQRKTTALYPKYKLITSHTCRRSFATNLYGQVSNSVIQSIGGWSSEAMMLHYIKKTKREQAEVLRDFWRE